MAADKPVDGDAGATLGAIFSEIIVAKLVDFEAIVAQKSVEPESLKPIGVQSKSVSVFYFSLWPDSLCDFGCGFRQSLEHIIWRAMMMALLSLEAPFWFEQLKKIVALRGSGQAQ